MVGLLTPIPAPRPKTLTFITSFSRKNKFGQERRSYDQSINLWGCVLALSRGPNLHLLFYPPKVYILNFLVSPQNERTMLSECKATTCLPSLPPSWSSKYC